MIGEKLDLIHVKKPPRSLKRSPWSWSSSDFLKVPSFLFSAEIKILLTLFWSRSTAFLMTPLKGFGHPFIKNQDWVDFFNFPSISPLKFFLGWFLTFADQAHDTLSEIKIMLLSKTPSQKIKINPFTLYKNRGTLSPL